MHLCIKSNNQFLIHNNLNDKYNKTSKEDIKPSIVEWFEA
jgi:hypothetical protein